MSLPASMPAGMSAAQMVDYKPVMSGMDAMDGMAGMGVEGEGFSGSASLGPLPPALRRGLPAVAFFGFLSFFLSVALLILLVWKIHRWRAKGSHPLNQFTVLILCLLVADIQQSLAFLLNVQWVTQDMIDVSSPTCWAQGWFVSTGEHSHQSA